MRALCGHCPEVTTWRKMFPRHVEAAIEGEDPWDLVRLEVFYAMVRHGAAAGHDGGAAVKA